VSASPVVVVYDTTLRDGTQREGISLSLGDKLRIAELLDRLGVTYIEGGFPGSNPKDAELFRRARDMRFQHATLVAFGATRRAHIAVEDDASLAALLDAHTSVCTIFGKSWNLHVTDVLGTTLDENLHIIEESVAYLRSHGRRVIYDAEHFFDGFAADPSYALETLDAAVRGGADQIVLCDTNGGSLPWDVEQVTRRVRGRIDRVIGVHSHDDTGCAVGNTLAAVRAGARHVQGTINGYGERCGNANLCTVIANLELKMGFSCLPEGTLPELSVVAAEVAEIANLPPDDHQPYVGRSAFAHKGGVHVAAMRKEARSYQHVPPERVGNRMRVVVSELSGRGNVLSQAEALGIDVPPDVALEVVTQIKEDEARGYSFEAAEGSVALCLERRRPGYRPPFVVRDYKVLLGRDADGEAFAEATVKVEVGGVLRHTAAEGSGPVQALDRALREALEPIEPAVRDIRLTDYKVRILDGREGTDATTRVLIQSSDGDRTWSTVGASANIIEASCRALVDSFEHGLLAPRLLAAG
jgi:2-isopropylmalate synthase